MLSEKMSRLKRHREPSPGVSEKKPKYERSDSDEGFSGMERPSLLGQLRAVLDEYPDSGQIIKELIQNAEDADAREVTILLDSRKIPEPKDLEPGEGHLKALKAPALCVYNDEEFTKEDWQGIRQLQMSIKVNKPLKVGRFGLGFKSVFHITDFPCIISGDSLLVISPAERKESRVCCKKKLKHLSKTAKKALLNVLEGNVGFKEKYLEKGYFGGTILWFPLRSTVTKSCVSNTVYSDKKVHDLFLAFRAEASVILLFLKSVDSIELQTRKKNTVKTIFKVHAKHDQPLHSEEFTSKVKDQGGKIAASSIEARKYVTIVQKDMEQEKKRRWLVISFYKGGEVSEELSSLCADPTLSYCPYVGVAVPLDDSVDNVQGQVFCFLPLPMEKHSPTGLKVHVNGFFALSQNRRHIKWPSAEQNESPSQTDMALQWNQCLLEEVLPEAYCILIDEVITFCRTEGNPDALVGTVYKLLPNESEISVHWRPLIMQIYSLLACGNYKIFYTPNSNGTWIRASDAVFMDPTISKTLKQTLEKVYTDYKKNVVQIEAHLHKTFQSQMNIELVTPQKLSTLLSSSKIYEKLERSQKLAVLKYLLTVEPEDLVAALNKLKLLPVASGQFTEFGTANPVYICEDQTDINLYPGLEENFLCPEVEPDLKDRLADLASGGILGLKKYLPKHFIVLLKKCMNLHFQDTEILPSGKLTLRWLEKVWTNINRCNIALSKLDDIPLIPQTETKSRTLLIRLNRRIIVRSLPKMTPLPEEVCAALKKLGAVVVSHVPSFIQCNTGILGTVIHYPTPEGVVTLLGDISEDEVVEVAADFNDSASDDEKYALINILGQHHSLNLSAKSVLQKLDLFPSSRDPDLNASLDKLQKLAPQEDFPFAYPVELLVPKSKMATELARRLGASYLSLQKIVQETLKAAVDTNQTIYTQDNIQKFMRFVIKNHPKMLQEPWVLYYAKQVRFLSTEMTNRKYRAYELFDPSDPILRSLFVEEEKFPSDSQMRGEGTRNILLSLGLKQKNQVTDEDLQESAKLIGRLYEENKNKNIKRKAVAFLQFLNWGGHIIHKTEFRQFLKGIKCIPCIISKPKNYPKSLILYNESESVCLESTQNIFSEDHLKLVGSVASVADEMPDRVKELLGLGKKPPVSLVLDHLQNISESYRSKDSSAFMFLLDAVYDFLSETSPFEANDLVRISRMNSVWTGMSSRFKRPSFVYLDSGKLNLCPYRIELPEEQKQHTRLFQRMGCHKDQNSQMLVNVLHEVKVWHDKLTLNNEVNLKATKRDLKIVTDIILELRDIDPRPEGVLLPVHGDNRQLLLLPVQECTYCNADWLKDQTETNYDEDDSENLSYVHEDISEYTAKKLGVHSLTDRVLADTESLDMNFGQTEPLTRRLKNLLKDYSDGFSVPKEILQNADDAGAKVVKFLYDERENKGARTCLMHEGMSPLQGPALWAFNDAEFSQDDFKNITKLSGATKECDKTKIGKFGLGFNAVYNITDVPSFISGNTVVIFDPHQSFLGKPGLKADLSSLQNKNMLRKMKGQFMPFEGIFGCCFGRSGSTCPGTLFRFPLRTKNQAKESDISSLSYDSDEMKKFIHTFAKGAGNLLLFTQNVTLVEFYHLQENLKKRKTLLFRVAKNVTSKTIQAQNRSITTQSPLNTSILSSANSLLETKNTCIVEKSTITVTTRKSKFLKEQYENSLSWNITWGFGEEASDHFVKTEKLIGLLPLAAVAIPMMSRNKDHHIASLGQCTDGFHKKGHLFCFLPLPIEIPLPVHINASFALTSNRKYLCTRSEDDKMITAEAEWNETLATDAIPLAYVNAIEKLQDVQETEYDSYFKLWPNCNCEEGLSKGIFLSFYKMIMNMPKKVFFEAETCKRICFQECTLLDPGLRFHNNVEIGHLALESFLHFNKGCRIIDIPEMIIKSIRCSGNMQSAVLNKHITTEECFFKTIFLPNISDRFWKNKGRARDKMTMHLLAKERLRGMLRSEPCIPTKPKRNLKKPEDLVHPHGKAAILYEDIDEVFPLNSFEPLFSVLCELGMKEYFLPQESIVERCKTVAMFHEAQNGRNRSLEILNYLSQTTETRKGIKRQRCGCRYEDYTDDLKHQLKLVPFLPVMQKPKSWPFVWAGRQKEFSLSSEVYFEETKHLVSSRKCILSHDAGSNSKALLKWLGVKGKSDVAINIVLQQLHAVSNVPFESKLEKVFLNLYAYLNEKCCEHDEDIQKCIGENSVLLVGNRIVSANKIAFRLNFDLSPHLYKVDKTLARYQDFLRTVGVRESFECSDGLAVLKIISKKAKSKKLTVQEAECFGRVTSFINEFESTDSLPDDEIELIGEDLHLYMPSDLCINDCKWLPNDSSKKFLHKLVNESVARHLGVKTNREADLALHSTPFFTPFGQKEQLTTRLKRILSGIPRDSSVMKELLQNADDAKASELMFIKDFRTHPGKRFFSEEWSELQGPALCVYNDSYFRKEDFEGIQCLGKGGKSEDLVQTGQYGVGFNAVYHITDAPSFLTVGPETEKTLCVLDPTCQYVPGASENNPGGRYTKLYELEKKYPDVFPCYLQNQLNLKHKGTIFRFPLRKEMSEICKEIVTEDDVKDITDEFQKDMIESLLFLQNVRKISIASINSRGKLSKDFEVVMDISKTDMDKLNFFQNCLKEQASKKRGDTNATKQCCPSEVKIIADIWNSRTNKKQKWLVIHRIGFGSDTEIPSDLQSNQDKISLLPRGGVAVPLTGDGLGLDDFEAKAFCILPLPIKTGLPMHVNGHFALDHETRRNLWNGNDYRREWNDVIAKQVIIPAYLSALKHIRDKIPKATKQKYFRQSIDRYHRLFPEILDASEDFWKSLMQCIYKVMFEKNLELFPVLTSTVSLKWVSLNCETGCSGTFNTIKHFVSEKDFSVIGYQTRKRFEVNLQNTLKNIGMKVLGTPLGILDNFEKAGLKDEISRVTPTSVIQFLRSHGNGDGDGCHVGDLPEALDNTNIKCLKNLVVLVQFCSKDELFLNELDGLPLALNNENTLRSFDPNEQLVVTAYPDLISGSAHQVLKDNLYTLFVSCQSTCLKRMDIATFATLLCHTLDPKLCMTAHPVAWPNDLSPNWITRVWCYLTEENKKKPPEHSRKEILQHLKQWSLIPSRVMGSSGWKYYLYPLEEGNKILNFNLIRSKRLAKELQHLPIPQLWYEDSAKDTEQFNIYLVVTHFVADEDRPESILLALASSCLKGQVRDSDVILQYLRDNLSEMKEKIGEDDMRLYLRKLPIFRTLDNSLISVDQCPHVYTIEEHSNIPAAGMKLISEESETTILRVSETSRALLSELQLVNTNPSKLYLDIVLPHFDAMMFQERYIHLKYIRDSLLPNEHDNSESLLKEKLKSLKFIQTKDGQYLPASSFYDRDHVVFQIICTSSSFPTPPFDKPKWRKFLKIAGLRCKVTTDEFVTFAKQVERAGKVEITKLVRNQSDVLISYLAKNCYKLEDDLVQKIRSIQFILPYNLHEERGQEGKHLVNIHAQPKHQLVSFCESVSPDHALLIWSTVPMVTKAAEEILCSSSVRKLLEVHDKPNHSCVIKHIQNVSTSISKIILTETSETSPSPTVTDVVKDVMTSIYRYLNEFGVTEETNAELKDYRTVYFPERGSMMKAEEVVIELLPEDEIKGYIEKAPVYFGQFFTVFRNLGAADRLNINSCLKVLEKLHGITGGQKLDPNERQILEKSLKLFIRCLDREKGDWQVQCLYLPNEQCILKDASGLIAADEMSLKDRIRALSLQYVMDFEECIPGFPKGGLVKYLELIPEKFRPTVLSYVLKETISDESKYAAVERNMSVKYKNLLTGELLTALVRLVHHVHCDEKKDDLILSGPEIEERLRAVKIVEVPNLHTVVQYEGTEVTDSTAEKNNFLDISADSEKGTLYLNADMEKDDVAHTLSLLEFARLINRCLDDCLQDKISVIEKMLQTKPEDLQRLLDGLQIQSSDFVSSVSKKSMYPPLGTFVEREFHWMLENSFTTLEVGEYVAVEIFDPCDMMEDGDDDDTDPVFIYAKVKSEIESDHAVSAVLKKYLLEVEEDRTEEVQATKIYRFCRERSQETKIVEALGDQTDATHVSDTDDLETILADIRKTLKEAWANFRDQKDRDRVRKRLYLKWHPDKNPGREDLCNNVCKMIQFYIQKLEKGEDIDNIKTRTQTSSFSRRWTPDPWFERMNRRSRSNYERYREKWRDTSSSRSFGTSSSETFTPQPQPQPQEAKRWLRQAQADLAAAMEALKIPSFNNWTCFKCQQAAEKSIKALWYKRDSRRADRLREHNLPALAMGLGKTEFNNLAVQLQRVIVDFNRLRYPDRFAFPRIPADQYSHNDAIKAAELAEKIVNVAVSLLS